MTSFEAAGLHPQLREGIWTNPAEVLTTRFLFFNQVVAVRREALNQIGFFREDLRIVEDYDLALAFPHGFLGVYCRPAGGVARGRGERPFP